MVKHLSVLSTTAVFLNANPTMSTSSSIYCCQYDAMYAAIGWVLRKALAGAILGDEHEPACMSGQRSAILCTEGACFTGSRAMHSGHHGRVRKTASHTLFSKRIMSLLPVLFLRVHLGCTCTEAVAGAHIVATDTWVSMGQEEEAAKRIKDYEGYQVSPRISAVRSTMARRLACALTLPLLLPLIPGCCLCTVVPEVIFVGPDFLKWVAEAEAVGCVPFCCLVSSTKINCVIRVERVPAGAPDNRWSLQTRKRSRNPSRDYNRGACRGGGSYCHGVCTQADRETLRPKKILTLTPTGSAGYRREAIETPREKGWGGDTYQ